MELHKKKEKNCLTPHLRTSEVGDAYTYLGFKKKSQFFIGFVVGKWNDETCVEFYKFLASRLRLPTLKRKLTIISDGNKQNITGITEAFPQGTIRYAQRKKIRRGQRILRIISEKVLGNAKWEDIAINQIDGFCSKLRERISCFTREARSFAKKKISLEQRLEIFSVQHNFMDMKKGKTPAMKEGLTGKKWTWKYFFNRRLSTLN